MTISYEVRKAVMSKVIAAFLCGKYDFMNGVC